MVVSIGIESYAVNVWGARSNRVQAVWGMEIKDNLCMRKVSQTDMDKMKKIADDIQWEMIKKYVIEPKFTDEARDGLKKVEITNLAKAIDEVSGMDVVRKKMQEAQDKGGKKEDFIKPSSKKTKSSTR